MARAATTTLPVTVVVDAAATLSTPQLRPAALPSLPPELLAQIFDPGSIAAADDGEELRLSPRSIPVCRALLPFTRKNAYHHVELAAGLSGIERFGRTLARDGGGEWIGGMVRRLTVRASMAPAPRGGGGDVDTDVDHVRAAFDALVNVERLDLALTGSEWARLVPLSSLLSARLRPWQGVALEVRLVEDDPCPVGLDALTRLLLFLSNDGGGGGGGARGIRSLRIKGRLPHKLCAEGRVAGTSAGFEEGEMCTGLEKLEIQCESHTIGLLRLLGSLAELKELRWTTPATNDPVAMMAAIPANVYRTLEVLEWDSSGYASRELGSAFSTLPALRSLTIRASSAVLSQAFFVSLHAHNPALEHLALYGPRAAGTGADTCALVGDWVEALRYEKEHGGGASTTGCGALRRVDLDVPRPPAWQLDRDEPRQPTRFEVQASRLAENCAKLGVTLGGSVLEAALRKV